MKKRILALVLSAVMVMGLSITAFAADGEIDTVTALTTGQAVTVTSTTTAPTIKVTVPTTAALTLNPYKISYTDAAGNIATNQIVSVPQAIVSESDVPLTVVLDKSFKATVANVTLDAAGSDGKAPAAYTDATTAKKGFIYLGVAAAKWNATSKKFEGAVPTSFNSATCAVLSETAPTEDIELYVLPAMKVAKKTSTTGTAAARALDEKSGNYVTVEAVTADGKTSYVTTTETPSAVAFGFGGFLNQYATTAWATTDTVTPTVKFTFKLNSN